MKKGDIDEVDDFEDEFVGPRWIAADSILRTAFRFDWHVNTEKIDESRKQEIETALKTLLSRKDMDANNKDSAYATASDIWRVVKRDIGQALVELRSLTESSKHQRFDEIAEYVLGRLDYVISPVINKASTHVSGRNEAAKTKRETGIEEALETKKLFDEFVKDCAQYPDPEAQAKKVMVEKHGFNRRTLNRHLQKAMKERINGMDSEE